MGDGERGWMTADEAMRYLGIAERDDAEDELERIVDEYEADAEIGPDGEVISVDPDDLREPLFAEHQRRLGHRPDDPDKVRRGRAAEQAARTRRMRRRKARRVVLRARRRRKAKRAAS